MQQNLSVEIYVLTKKPNILADVLLRNVVNGHESLIETCQNTGVLITATTTYQLGGHGLEPLTLEKEQFWGFG